MIEVQKNIVLREAQAADAWDIAGLRFASLMEMGHVTDKDRKSFIPRAANEIFQLFKEERLVAWLLVADGVPCGSACVLFWRRLPYANGSVHAEIAGVYVMPALRRNGYATELVREALANAQARGVRKISLSPTEVGRSIYERLGFKNELQMVLRS